MAKLVDQIMVKEFYMDPDDKEPVDRCLQMGVHIDDDYADTDFIGEPYLGKRKLHAKIVMPGNVHAHQHLMDVTSKEYQVGKIRKQGSTPL